MGLAYNPFPGLRPFGTDESHLFFGRTTQTDIILQRLDERRFVSVLGASGSGKSSLVRAGVVPALHAGRLLSRDSRWKVVILRPGGAPIHNLAAALAQLPFRPGDKPPTTAIGGIEATLRRSALGLPDAVAPFANDGRCTLVIIDQFEELFRFAESGTSGADDATAFVKLLVEASRTDEHGVHVLLTMRSDFLGHCSGYDELPEVVDATVHLVPRLSRDQLRTAIEGPVAVAGGDISSRLVQRLLNDVGRRADTLPLLQHVLMRSWDIWQDMGGRGPLDLDHYERSGMIERALSLHADDAYGELTVPQADLAERMFKALVSTGADGHKVRHPTPVREIGDIADVNDAQVLEVVQNFSTARRNFLVLSEDEIVDISHESLIREWTRLNGWADEEARAGESYRRLATSARRHEAGAASLLRGRDLKDALQSWASIRPNLAWASRHGGHFVETERYLRRSKRRSSARAAISGTALLLTVSLLAFLYVRTIQSERNLRESEESLQAASGEVARLTDELQPLIELVEPPNLRQRLSNTLFAIEVANEGGLTIGTILPLTGDLAFLSPAMVAGAELAVGDINEAGGVFGAEVMLETGDSGDTTNDLAVTEVERLLELEVDAIVGAASSAVSKTVIDRIAAAGVIQISPSNTSPDFTTYEDNGLYFRTAASDLVQGSVLASAVLDQRNSTASVLFRDESYGAGLAGTFSESFEAGGGVVDEYIPYSPDAANFDEEIDRLVVAGSDAVIVIGFAESATILESMHDRGIGPTSRTSVWGVDGNIGIEAEVSEPSILATMRFTVPAIDEDSISDFIDRLRDAMPPDSINAYGAETYDSIVILALAAEIAQRDDGVAIAAEINDVTRGGEKCTSFASCKAIIDSGGDPDYDGLGGPYEFIDAGEPAAASFRIETYGEDGRDRALDTYVFSG